MGKPIANVAAFIRGMSFEERDAVVRNWDYDRSRANRTMFDTADCKRSHAEVVYLGHYNVDNLYELCVFKNYIYLLNKGWGKISPSDQVHKDGVTLGHWLPMGKGGAHLPSNWFIQKASDNFRSGDKILPESEKWDLNTQTLELIHLFLSYDKRIDTQYSEDLKFYKDKFKEVY